MARLFRFVLVAALLFGWQSALVHPLSHVDEQGQLVHLGTKSSAGASCDALAALTACAPQASLPLGISAALYLPPVHLAGAPRAAAAPPFLSQGPPAAV